MATNSSRVVVVTCGSLAEARRIAKSVVEQRLAACVNILVKPVESIYRWKGLVAKAREYMIVIKTVKRRIAALEAAIHKLHSYEVPEFVVLPIVGGSRKYLQWLEESVRETRREGASS